MPRRKSQQAYTLEDCERAATGYADAVEAGELTLDYKGYEQYRAQHPEAPSNPVFRRLQFSGRHSAVSAASKILWQRRRAREQRGTEIEPPEPAL